MNTGSDLRRRTWPGWAVATAGTVALIETFLLGTLGWFGSAFGIGSDCTDKFSCGSDSCAPCAKAHAWVSAGGIGQWVLALAAAALLVLAGRRPDWRRAATITIGALILLAVAWYAIATAVAERSF